MVIKKNLTHIDQVQITFKNQLGRAVHLMH